MAKRKQQGGEGHQERVMLEAVETDKNLRHPKYGG